MHIQCTQINQSIHPILAYIKQSNHPIHEMSPDQPTNQSNILPTYPPTHPATKQLKYYQKWMKQRTR